ncbi:MAG TPA: response regulator [Rhodocyclaceae bacterium]|nr:response regulator [Rhodocyclaceae bacterium]
MVKQWACRSACRSVVYLVDDDESVLKMLRHLIHSAHHIEVRAYTSADDFIAAYRPGPCECLVSDVRMPGIGGLELQQRLKELGVTLPIVFLSGCTTVGTVVEAMKQGAVDYLEKPFAAAVLLDKVHLALERSRHLHAEALARDEREAQLAQLTARERQIAQLVADGRSSREIASLLHLSVRTVENHRARIMEKLDVHSSVTLVKLLG